MLPPFVPMAAALPTRRANPLLLRKAVEGQKPRPRSEARDPDHHSGELASV